MDGQEPVTGHREGWGEQAVAQEYVISRQRSNRTQAAGHIDPWPIVCARSAALSILLCTLTACSYLEMAIWQFRHTYGLRTMVAATLGVLP